MICQKVNNMIQPTQNFQFILGDLMEMIKLQNADFKHPFILNIRGLNIQLKRMCLFVSAVSFHSWGKRSSPFFLLSYETKETIYEVQWATKDFFCCSDIS